MAKITAKSEDLTITIEDTDGIITVLFNGEEDDIQLENLRELARYAPPMGGTFYPEPGTMLSYYNVLQSGFFADWMTDITVEGDIGEMPCEDGCIY